MSYYELDCTALKCCAIIWTGFETSIISSYPMYYTSFYNNKAELTQTAFWVKVLF